MVSCLMYVPFLLTMRVYGKTLQATLLFYLMYVCVFIYEYRNDSMLMTIYKYEKRIKQDALVSMGDMSVRARSPTTWSASCWKKNIF